MRTRYGLWSVVFLGTLIVGCGVSTSAAAHLRLFVGTHAAIGPTPSTWPTDHRLLSNNSTAVAASFAGPGPHYVVQFPYKVSSDTPVVNGLAYLTSGDVSGTSHPAAGTLWAVDPASGRVIWRRTLPNTAFAEPIVADGRVYVGVGNILFPRSPSPTSRHLTRGTGVSGVWAFSARSGELLWHMRTDGADQAPVTVSHGVVYLASGDRYFYALNAATGAMLWKVPLHAYVSRSGPRIIGSMAFVGGADPGSVVAINLLSHRVAWRTLIPNAQAGVDDTPLAYAHGILLTAAITVRHDQVLPSTSLHHHADLFALSAATGHILWHRQLARGTMPNLKATGTPLIAGSTAYVGNAINGAVTAVALTNGHVLWRFTADSPVKKPPVLAQGRLYFVSLHGTLYALSTAGRLLARQSLGPVANVRGPVLINRTLLVVLNTVSHGYLWAEPVNSLR